jgi:flavin-binding protein dodecin
LDLALERFRDSRVGPLINLEGDMTVAKVTEISASSAKSFDDAMQVGIDRANKTLDKVKGAWVNEMKVIVEDGKITQYRVNMKVSFILKG